MQNRDRSGVWFIPLFMVLPWIGCKAPIRAPGVKPPERVRKDESLAHLLGAWELPGKEGTKRMIFEPSGQLSFRGGLEFFNPAEWSLDTNQHELKIRLPNTPNEKLD